MIDHGGNLDVARARFGGELKDWIDLSTGINRQPYPIPELSPHHWNALPSRAEIAALHAAARLAYATTAPLIATAGAQAAIQLLPRLAPSRRAKILGPTYGEFAAVLQAAHVEAEEVDTLAALEGADLAVVVNPNNPDGRRHDPQLLLSLAARVRRLVVDESFADTTPERSLAPQAGRPGLLILRSFGKFYGLAGLRLGFVLGSEADIATLAGMSGPWPVSGLAIEIGRRALEDRNWASETMSRLARDAKRLDGLTGDAGWQFVGGTPLFRLYETGNAQRAQELLARRHIWSRTFSYNASWLRLGLPGDEAEWQRLGAALSCQRE
jgi:cobalamin biosynthesis protein CobC